MTKYIVDENESIIACSDTDVITQSKCVNIAELQSCKEIIEKVEDGMDMNIDPMIQLLAQGY